MEFLHTFILRFIHALKYIDFTFKSNYSSLPILIFQENSPDNNQPLFFYKMKYIVGVENNRPFFKLPPLFSRSFLLVSLKLFKASTSVSSNTKGSFRAMVSIVKPKRNRAKRTRNLRVSSICFPMIRANGPNKLLSLIKSKNCSK